MEYRTISDLQFDKHNEYVFIEGTVIWRDSRENMMNKQLLTITVQDINHNQINVRMPVQHGLKHYKFMQHGYFWSFKNFKLGYINSFENKLRIICTDETTIKRIKSLKYINNNNKIMVENIKAKKKLNKGAVPIDQKSNQSSIINYLLHEKKQQK